MQGHIRSAALQLDLSAPLNGVYGLHWPLVQQQGRYGCIVACTSRNSPKPPGERPRCCSGPALDCYPECTMLLLQGLQDHTPAGRLFSAPLLALILGLGAAWTGLMPLSSPAYDLVWSHAIPLATALYLLEADLRGWAPLLLCMDGACCNRAMLGPGCSWHVCTLRPWKGSTSLRLCCRIIRSTGTVFVAFCIASAATIIGTLVAWACVGSQLGQEGWKVWAAAMASID